MTYFIAPDAHSTPTLWQENGDFPLAILSQSDLPPSARPLFDVMAAAVVESAR